MCKKWLIVGRAQRWHIYTHILRLGSVVPYRLPHKSAPHSTSASTLIGPAVDLLVPPVYRLRPQSRPLDVPCMRVPPVATCCHLRAPGCALHAVLLVACLDLVCHCRIAVHAGAPTPASLLDESTDRTRDSLRPKACSNTPVTQLGGPMSRASAVCSTLAACVRCTRLVGRAAGWIAEGLDTCGAVSRL